MTEYEVGEADTAIALGSGDVPVLGTPRLLAWLEAATVAAAAPFLADGQTSVGIEVHIRHRRPSAIGSLVRVHALAHDPENGRITFDVRAEAADGTVLADGQVVRAVVERSAFG
jgi:fluoroacetyl-CoA thioesterase